MDIDASISAGISIGDIEKVADGIVGRLKDEPRPFYLSRTASATGTGAIVFLDLGAPPTGSIWQIRCITLFGNDDHTVVSSVTGSLYTGDYLNLSLASLKVTGLSFPSTTFIPDTAIWCHPNENLVIATSAIISAGQQVGANVVVEEWKERDVSRSLGY